MSIIPLPGIPDFRKIPGKTFLMSLGYLEDPKHPALMFRELKNADGILSVRPGTSATAFVCGAYSEEYVNIAQNLTQEDVLALTNLLT